MNLDNIILIIFVVGFLLFIFHILWMLFSLGDEDKKND